MVLNKALIALALGFVLAACTERQQELHAETQKNATLTCWSGGEVVLEVETDGPISRWDSGTFAYKNKSTGRWVEVYHGFCSADYHE